RLALAASRPTARVREQAAASQRSRSRPRRCPKARSARLQRDVNLGEQVLGRRVTGRVVVDLEGRGVSRFATAGREPGAVDQAVGITQAIVGAAMEQDAEVTAAEDLDAHLALRLEILADCDAAIEAELVSRRDVWVVMSDADHFCIWAEQAALAGPLAEAL